MTNSQEASSIQPRPVPIEEIAPEVLRRGGSIAFIATGTSMWPHVRHGDTVNIEPLAPGAVPRAGWIIVYLTPRGRVGVHRVIGRSGSGSLKVRGDAFTGRPEQVTPEAVLGRVVGRVRDGKSVNLMSGTRKLEGWLIALTGAVRVYSERVLRVIVWRVRRKSKD